MCVDSKSTWTSTCTQLICAVTITYLVSPFTYIGTFDANAHSSGFAELLDGVVSVRAFSAESRFMAQLCEQVDRMHSAFYYYWMMNRWVSVPC